MRWYGNLKESHTQLKLTRSLVSWTLFYNMRALINFTAPLDEKPTAQALRKKRLRFDEDSSSDDSDGSVRKKVRK